MPKSWYCKMGNELVGPLSAGELRALAQSGQLRPTDEIRQGEQGAWHPAARYQGFSFKPPLVNSPPSPSQPTTSSSMIAWAHLPRRWLWLGTAVLGMVLLFCAGVLTLFLPTRPAILLRWTDGTPELQVMAAQLNDEQKLAMGMNALLTGFDLYALRVRITNVGSTPLVVSPEHLRLQLGAETIEVSSVPNPPFLLTSHLAPGASSEGLIVFQATLTAGTKIRSGAGRLRYFDPAVDVRE